MKSKLTETKLPAPMVALLVATLVISFSCQKSSVSSAPPSGTANTQKLAVTNFFIDASAGTDENFDMVTGTGEYEDNAVAKSSCKTITYSPSKDVYPHTKTIDFGAGCPNASGIVKSGKIIITYYDPTQDAQGKYTLTTYDNYYVDGIKTEGSIQVNKTRNGSGQDVYEHITHKTISDASGDVKDYNSDAVWTVISWNGGTDNAYEITEHTIGNEVFEGVESNNFQTDIDEANHVIKPFVCKHRAQGGLIAKIHLTHVDHGDPNDLDEYLDYGNGDCDNLATLSINGGAPEQVTIPLRFWPLNL